MDHDKMDHDKMDYNKAKELLFEGIIHGNFDLVKEGLKVVKDVNIKNEDGLTILHIAIWGSSEFEVVKYLITIGADVNIKNINGWTPLHYASFYGHLETVKYLISKGADVSVNIQNRNGWTPLNLASMYGKLEIVKYLINRGSDLNLENEYTINRIKKLLKPTKMKIFDMFLEARSLHQAKAGIAVIGNIIGELYDSDTVLEFSEEELMAIAEFGTQNRPKEETPLKTDEDKYKYLYLPLSEEYPHLFGYLKY